MLRRQASASVLLLAALIVVTGCSGGKPEAQEATGAASAEQPPALVKAALIRQELVAPEFRAMGNVRPRHFSVVASGADGVVAEFPIEVGDFVRGGTLISKLRMESPELEMLEQEAMVRAH